MVAFDAGARAETDKYTPGMAHMLEHMMFKGTEKRGYLDIPKEVAFLGGDVNAFTSHEMVCYYIRVPYENFEKGMEILSDVVLHSTFPEEEFLKEREVVLEECLAYKDQVTNELQDRWSEEFHSGRLTTDIIGTQESIKTFTRDELVAFHDEFYKSDSAILSVSGDIEIENMKSTSEKLFGPETDFIRKTEAGTHEYKKAVDVHVHRDNTEQSYVYVTYPGLAMNEQEHKAAGTILVDILGSGMDSRLFTEVREKNNLCYSIGLQASSHLEVGDFTVYSSTRAENIEKMLGLIDIEIQKIKNELVTEEELQRAKNKSKSDIYAIYDSGHSLAKVRMTQEFFNLPSLEEVSSKIDAVTREDVLSLANKIFDEEFKMTFILNDRGAE
jgi:predicted Zn-dependent peptidase